jgi:GNAT superfamily N-acetyltransferase
MDFGDDGSRRQELLKGHADMKWTKDNFWITDDNQAADIDFITAELEETYWAEGRSPEVVEESVRNSVMLSMFDGARPIGFARIVSDYSTFAWLCDVCVLPEYRGRKLGVWLMECVLAHPSTQVRLNLLATRDAHGLYEKFGYKHKDCMVLFDNGAKTPPPDTPKTRGKRNAADRSRKRKRTDPGARNPRPRGKHR